MKPHDRLSFRSPMRKKNNIITKQKQSCAHNRISCRSPLNQQKKHETTYKIVTQTPSGQTVKVPTTSHSFIKFTNPMHRILPAKIEKETTWMPYQGIDYTFDEALEIYENNQTYYLEKIEKEYDLNIINDIKSLETWFFNFDTKKDKHGYSIYFDSELLPYMI
ncbi:MAG TPA: hypothetical protein VLG50_05590 [Candidatus Saccharimonadales bacterium]|nr:hypothetical protein [Candidatus Saccharimonadales bacterium]